MTAQARAPLGIVTAGFSRRGIAAIELSADAAAGLDAVRGRFGRRFWWMAGRTSRR